MRVVADQARGAGVALWLVSEITISRPLPQNGCRVSFLKSHIFSSPPSDSDTTSLVSDGIPIASLDQAAGTKRPNPSAPQLAT